MLEAVKGNGVSRYSIMKHTGTNPAQIKKYLEPLVKMGLIETDIKDGRVLYKASEKGHDFLRQYYVLLGILLNTRAHGNVLLPKRVKVRES
jgi:predicted transcriptional regulator